MKDIKNRISKCRGKQKMGEIFEKKMAVIFQNSWKSKILKSSKMSPGLTDKPKSTTIQVEVKMHKSS